jgi:hypothetical protein
MSGDKIRKLEAHSTIRKQVWFKIKGMAKRELWGTVEDEVYIIVGDEDDPYKHMIQRIRPAEHRTWDGSTHYYRTGYYTFTGKGPERLTWGQYTQLLTHEQYQQLLAKAKQKGWNLF